MKTHILKEEVDQIINQSFWTKGGIKLTESTTEVSAETPAAEEQVSDSDEQVVEETEEHACPLCESRLEAPISDEQLAEHVNLMVEIISEMSDVSDEELEALEEDASEDEETVEEAKSMPKDLAKKMLKGKKSDWNPKSKVNS